MCLPTPPPILPSLCCSLLLVASSNLILTYPFSSLILLSSRIRRIQIESVQFFSLTVFQLRTGQYKGWEPLLLLGNDVHHKTIGIVGFGRIGYAVAKRAKGFDMNIIYHDIDEKPYAKDLGAKLVSMETLLKASNLNFYGQFYQKRKNY